MMTAMGKAAPARIGVLGGTFNPVHIGHLILAQDACELFDLGRVLFIPCNRPPHKAEKALAAVAHRVAMLQAAVGGDPRFEVCDLEVRRGGISYSVDTARELRALYPAAEICFIVGSDSLVELHLWKEIETLLQLCRFVALMRPEGEGARPGQTVQLPDPWPERLRAGVRTGHVVNVSSSDIRRRCGAGRSIRYLVPAAVETYIQRQELYRS